MKRPTIIEGRPFDWDAAAKAADNVVGDDGEVNWRAAFSADPGILSCPFCDERMWWEGTVVECPTCGQRFNTNWREVARKASGRDPVVHRMDNEVHARLVGILHDACDKVRKGDVFGLPHNTPPLIHDFVHIARGGSLLPDDESLLPDDDA